MSHRASPPGIVKAPGPIAKLIIKYDSASFKIATCARYMLRAMLSLLERVVIKMPVFREDGYAPIGAGNHSASAPPALLGGKRILVTGVATRASIAFAVAELAQQLGAEVILTSFGRMRRLTERAATQLPNAPDVLGLDVNEPADFARLRHDLAQRWSQVDGVVHAIAFAPPDAIGEDFLATPPESAELAFRTSAYSLQALTACLAPLMPSGGSVVGLDFDATRAWPGYNWMGVAKAALEAVARYLALDLGPRGIRVNLVSAGPLKTTASRGIPGFDQLADLWTLHAPLGWDTSSPKRVAGPVCFLLSDLASGVTGEILHVDGGLHAVGFGRPVPVT